MFGLTGLPLAFVFTVAILACAATITTVVGVIGTTVQRTSYNRAAAKIGQWKPPLTDEEIKNEERVRMGVQREHGDPTR